MFAPSMPEPFEVDLSDTACLHRLLVARENMAFGLLGMKLMKVGLLAFFWGGEVRLSLLPPLPWGHARGGEAGGKVRKESDSKNGRKGSDGWKGKSDKMIERAEV